MEGILYFDDYLMDSLVNDDIELDVILTDYEDLFYYGLFTFHNINQK